MEKVEKTLTNAFKDIRNFLTKTFTTRAISKKQILKNKQKQQPLYSVGVINIKNNAH